jgi:rRNA maturation RNase YbeY
MPVDVCGHGIEMEAGLAELVLKDASALLAAAELDEQELSIALTDDPGIRALNGAWRETDKATDVLSFPQDLEGLLGDLVISLETAQRQADARGHALQDELRILLVHGLLHLRGHDHEQGADGHAQMAAEEQTLMAKLGWRGQGLIALAELP